MLQKYSVLIGITISLALLMVATMVYPGGSLDDNDSIGFDWSKNYISNLFGSKAVNGAENPARTWADAGMIFLSMSFALFFIQYSRKIPMKGASKIIKYFGVGGMACTFLIVTPLHNIMVAISSTMFLVSLFYITVFILKSRLHLFKALCIICLLVFYYTLYLYGTGQLNILPVMQKITFASTTALVLALHHFTRKEDFTSAATTNTNP